MLRNFAIALGAAALAIPAISAAQPSYGGGYSYYGRNYEAPPRGDYRPYGDYASQRRFTGYPEFRGIEEHIRGEIVDGIRGDLIERDDAQDLFRQLRDIQGQEMREFRVHGWRLPEDDRARIGSELQQLDRLVDQIREEP